MTSRVILSIVILEPALFILYSAKWADQCDTYYSMYHKNTIEVCISCYSMKEIGKWE